MSTQVAGGSDTSIIQPSWTYDNDLLYVGDQTDWWNLYLITATGEHVNLMPRSVECGGPQWNFGLTPYMVDPRGNGDIVVVHGNVRVLIIYTSIFNILYFDFGPASFHIEKGCNMLCPWIIQGHIFRLNRPSIKEIRSHMVQIVFFEKMKFLI